MSNLYLFVILALSAAGLTGYVYREGDVHCQDEVAAATASAQAKQTAIDTAQQKQLQSDSDTFSAMDDEDLKDSINWQKKYENLVKTKPVQPNCVLAPDVLRTINNAGEGDTQISQ